VPSFGIAKHIAVLSACHKKETNLQHGRFPNTDREADKKCLNRELPGKPFAMKYRMRILSQFCLLTVKKGELIC